MKLLLYNIVFPIAFLLYLPLFIYKLVRRGGFTHDFWERFGLYGRERKQRFQVLTSPVWIHAVSVGEVVAAVSFIRRWQERQPERDFVLSTTTTTGYDTARAKLPENVVLIYCPLDFFFAVRRALRLIHPAMLVIFEVEIWPNLIAQAVAQGTPVALANGRMSDRSAAGYVRHGWFFRSLFGKFSAMCVQSEEDGKRVRRVVGDTVPVYVCNTMKFDQVPDVSHVDRTALLQQVFGPAEQLIWIAGSTHAGEEALVAKTFTSLKGRFPSLKLILVPRHHERTPEAERALAEHGISYRLLQPDQRTDSGNGPVDALVVNTTGELMNFYAVSDVVFVGKSLAGNQGGHNIIEPAIFGKAIVHGAAMQNFRAVAKVFRDEDATIEIDTDDQLADGIGQLLADTGRRNELGGRARNVVERWRGAIDRTLAHLEPLLVESNPNG